MGKGPLDDPRLRAIEERLNAASFDEAQRLLSALSERDSLRPGASYLATRLLYQRGRLDNEAVVQRLRDVVLAAGEFPEARAMLSAAEGGLLSPEPAGFRSATLPPESSPTLVDPREPESWKGSAAPPIPRAPAMPKIQGQVELELGLEVPRVPGIPTDLAPPPLQPAEGDLAYRRTAPADDPPLRVPARPRARDTLQELVSIPASFQAPPVSAGADGAPSVMSPSSSAKPPSSGSAWRKKGEPQAGDTLPPSSRKTERPESPRSPAFELGPRAVPPGSMQLEAIAPPAPEFTRSSPPSSVPRKGDGPPGKIRSIQPGAPEEEEAPTGLGVAALLDDGEPARALSLLERWGGPLTPELVILRARALAGTGRRGAALSELERVAQAPLVEPELRASCARLLIELDELDLALSQARRAYDDDPNSVMARLALAWGLVRAARRVHDKDSYQRAESLLSALRPRATPLPALVHALRACVTAALGDPEKAITTAQLGVGLDPRSADALAALAQASLRLGRRGDAERAWLRLREIDRVEARALARTLEAAGIDVDALAPSSRKLSVAPDLAIWDPLERELAAGRKETTIAAVERLCGTHARSPAARTSPHDFSAFATEASAFFSTAPVFRHFAPYDLSLASTSRLEAALSVLYGSGARLNPLTNRHPIVLFIGSYLGECVRQAFDGRWRGSPSAPEQAAVEARGHEYSPFERVEQRLKLGRSIRLDAEVSAHPAAEPHAHRVPPEVTPPAPWDPLEWPEPASMQRLGRALSNSVVALYTAELAGGPLDGSVASVATLDQYVALLSPATAPPDAGAGWVRRAAALTGAYLIEVLCENLGATYVPNEAVAGPLAYEVALADGTATHPVLQAYDRLAGKRMLPLSDYVARVAKKR